MSKRHSDGSVKSRSRMSAPSNARDDTGSDAGNGGHEETQLDRIASGWKIFRGPPTYTHAVLPWIYEQQLSTPEFVRDYTFRMTSPYDPIHDGAATDINIGAGVASAVQAQAVDTKNQFGRNVAYWDYYASMYKYYSVLGCRYKVRVENLSTEKFFVHAMYVTNTNPPANASNWDMRIWKGVRSYLAHPYHRTTTSTSPQINMVEIDNLNMDYDTMVGSATNNAASQIIQNPTGSPFVYITGEYRPGQADQMIHEDDAVSIWTPVTANPTLREALMIRIKPYDNATPSLAGSADNYQRQLTYNLSVECEYLVEFKELNEGLRWPISRNPLTVTITTNPQAVGVL